MITSIQEYNELLYALNDPNNEENAQYYRIPSDEPIYKIDLNSRTVESPQFLSVLEDHNAEVIWFSVDRFYDDVDLFGATCYVQYKNALNEQFVTLTIPQVIPEADHNTMYIPWPISTAATRAVGNITFSFQFFKMSEDEQRVFYSIHTRPATSKVLDGLHVDPLDVLETDDKINPQYSDLMNLFMKLSEDYSNLKKDYNVYWLEV